MLIREIVDPTAQALGMQMECNPVTAKPAAARKSRMTSDVIEAALPRAEPP